MPSSCDKFREILLTGPEDNVRASVKAILADKSANTTAREISKHYLNLETANTSRQTTDLEIINDYCGR